jgi:hypothetical protein
MCTNMKSLRLLTLGGMTAFLICALACLGNDTIPTNTSAQKLVYSDPPASGYHLTRDASSTDAHLVLKLVGPSGEQIQGGVFILSADNTKTAWGSAGGSDAHIKEGSALSLGSGMKLLKSQVSGQTLSAAIFQKGSPTPATLGSQPILFMALDLKTGTARGPVSLSSGSSQVLDGTGRNQAVAVAVGSLKVE